MKATELIAAYLEAKSKEEAAKANRQQLAKALANLLGYPDEGQKTHKVDGYNVVVKGVVNRCVDWDAFDALNLPHLPPVKVKRELDIKGLAWYAEHEPEAHVQILKTITAKPGQPSVSIKEPTK